MRQRQLPNFYDNDYLKEMVIQQFHLSFWEKKCRWYTSTNLIQESYIRSGGWVPNELYTAKKERRNICSECYRLRWQNTVHYSREEEEKMHCKIWFDEDFSYVHQEGKCPIDFTRYIYNTIAAIIKRLASDFDDFDDLDF